MIVYDVMLCSIRMARVTQAQGDAAMRTHNTQATQGTHGTHRAGYDGKMRARPPLHFFLLLLSFIICIWLGTNNYKLSTQLHASEESAGHQAESTRNHILQLDKLVTQLHGNADNIKKEYTSIAPQIEELLTKQQQEHNHISTQLQNTQKRLVDVESKKDELEQQLHDLVSSMNVGHKENMKKVGKSFKDGKIDLSVIVAYDWEDSTKSVRPLSLLYIMDYFNIIASKVCPFHSSISILSHAKT